MPRGDRTGPSGQGPGTGRAFGYCYGFDSPGYTKGPGRGMGYGFGRGMGRGRGYGRGWGYNAPYQGFNPDYQRTAPVSKEDEIRFLKSDADALKKTWQDLEKRIADLEKDKK